ncbi:MAG: hypothetical protein AAGC86_03225 [Pseudomonadota bacterium]
MAQGITRRRALAAGAAAGLLGHPGGLLAQHGALAAQERLGWDDLAGALDRPVRIAGFLHPLQPDGDSPTAALLPCLSPVPPPPEQWLLLRGQTLPELPSDILVLEAAGRIEAQGSRFVMAPDELRLLLRL